MCRIHVDAQAVRRGSGRKVGCWLLVVVIVIVVVGCWLLVVVIVILVVGCWLLLLSLLLLVAGCCESLLALACWLSMSLVVPQAAISHKRTDLRKQ